MLAEQVSSPPLPTANDDDVLVQSTAATYRSCFLRWAGLFFWQQVLIGPSQPSSVSAYVYARPRFQTAIVLHHAWLSEFSLGVRCSLGTDESGEAYPGCDFVDLVGVVQELAVITHLWPTAFGGGSGVAKDGAVCPVQGLR